MTKQRKMRLRQKFEESRGRLMKKTPFFALLLMYLKFVADPEISKISTNGRCIYFSPDYIDKLYPRELDFLLCHQVMHIICGHIWRSRDLAGDDHHIACDISVNSQLQKFGFNEEKHPHLGSVYSRVPGVSTEPDEMTPQEIYELLPYSLYSFNEKARSKFFFDSEDRWDNKNDCGEGGEIIIDIPELEGRLGAEGASDGIEDGIEDVKSSKDLWNMRAVMAADALSGLEDDEYEDKGVGKIPEFLKRMIEDPREPLLDWKKLLNDFLQESVCDYSFSPPDRRFYDSEFFLPDFNDKEFVTKEILFMVDTSGSVDDEELTAVYSEIRGALEQFDGKLIGKLGFFDAAVIPPIPFMSVDELINIIPYGGGGTDFFAIFDYIRNNYTNELPASLVIFTDGKSSFPPESEAMGIPTLWIINNSDETPPFGTVARLAENDIKA